jgi:hypothetical protein
MEHRPWIFTRESRDNWKDGHSMRSSKNLLYLAKDNSTNGASALIGNQVKIAAPCFQIAGIGEVCYDIENSLAGCGVIFLLPLLQEDTLSAVRLQSCAN